MADTLSVVIYGLFENMHANRSESVFLETKLILLTLPYLTYNKLLRL